MDTGITHFLLVRIGSKNTTWFSAKEGFGEWYAEMGVFGNDALHIVAYTIRIRKTEMLNYLIHRPANVFAESLNARIRHFKELLIRVADVPFFPVRLSKPRYRHKNILRILRYCEILSRMSFFFCNFAT